jgi:tetratricopeptide (TPR) repeat protein
MRQRGSLSSILKLATFLLCICFSLAITGMQDGKRLAAGSMIVSQTGYDALLKEAQVLFNLKKYDEALETVTKAIDLQSDRPLGHVLKANILEALHQTHDAISEMTIAITLSPQVASYYYARGDGYLAIGDEKSAINDFSNAIALGAKSPAAYHDRGVAFKRSGRYVEAIEDFSTALEIDPARSVSLLNRAVAYICLNDIENALKDVNTILTRSPGDMEAHLLRASIFVSTNDFKAALVDLEHIKDKGFQEAWVSFNLGKALYHTGHLMEAMDANENAMKFNDVRIAPDVYFQKGLFLLILGQTDKAQQLYDMGIKYSEKSLDLDSLEDGIEDLKESIQKNPSSKDLAESIIQRLEQVRGRIASRAKPAEGRCHRFKV